VKPGTTTNLKAGKRQLLAFFNPDMLLADITPGDADEWLVWLESQFANATAGKTVKRARQFFRAAVRKKIIAENPFGDVKPPSEVNKAREHFISLDAAYRVFDACADAEWRLLFALSRFGGLRCPCEHLSLTWADVDWERERFRVDSPKTGVRWVPIFPELRPYLAEAFELAPEGAVHVINRYRDRNQNLRTWLNRIIGPAGLEPWPRLFQNLRATRETELNEIFPTHVVCAWLGNTNASPPSTICKSRKSTSPAPPKRPARQTSHQTPKHRKIQRSTSTHRTKCKNPGQTEGFCEIPCTFCGANHDPDGIRTRVAALKVVRHFKKSLDFLGFSVTRCPRFVTIFVTNRSRHPRAKKLFDDLGESPLPMAKDVQG
jgi:integrase